MTTIDILLDESLLNVLGAGSLVGIAMSKNDGKPVGPGIRVRLLFPQTGLGWRMAHGGPDAMVLTENAPMFLAEGILHLLEKGCSVEVIKVDKQGDANGPR